MFSSESRMPRLRSNESPSGAFKRQSGLAQARWRGLAPTSSGSFPTAVCPKPYSHPHGHRLCGTAAPGWEKDLHRLHRGRGCTGRDHGAEVRTGLPHLQRSAGLCRFDSEWQTEGISEECGWKSWVRKLKAKQKQGAPPNRTHPAKIHRR